MARIGASIEELSDLKAAFDRQAEQVMQLARTIRTQLDNTAWEGPASERFRSSWSGEFEPSMGKLSGALRDAGVEVDKRREALLQAGG